VQARLAAHYGTDPKVCNESRVMRLAGTLHLKNPSQPLLVRIEVTDTWECIGGPYASELVQDGLPTIEAKLSENGGGRFYASVNVS
jgi:hypothetical protein